MLKFHLSLKENIEFSFLPVVNLLVESEVMSLEEAAVLNRKFQSGEQVIFDVPCEIGDKLTSELKHHGCTFEIKDSKI